MAAAAIATVPEAEPRLSRVQDLVELIGVEDERTRGLRERLDNLAAQIKDLQETTEGREERLDALRAEIDQLAPFAGLSEVVGPGVVVELTDSTMRTSPTGDPNDLVVHEEDLQAVVNGLWAAGAEGLSVNGERITALSAIRCVGNTLLLHDSVYSPPYVIAAVGDPKAILEGLASDPMVERVRIVSREFGLGFSVREQDLVTLPAFRGILATRYATAASPR